MSATKWAVEFDYRVDGGPDLVGPFDSKQDAELFLLAINIGDFEAGYRQLTDPAAASGVPEGNPHER